MSADIVGPEVRRANLAYRKKGKQGSDNIKTLFVTASGLEMI